MVIELAIGHFGLQTLLLKKCLLLCEIAPTFPSQSCQVSIFKMSRGDATERTGEDFSPQYLQKCINPIENIGGNRLWQIIWHILVKKNFFPQIGKSRTVATLPGYCLM